MPVLGSKLRIVSVPTLENPHNDPTSNFCAPPLKKTPKRCVSGTFFQSHSAKAPWLRCLVPRPIRQVQIFQDSWNIEQDLKNPDRCLGDLHRGEGRCRWNPHMGHIWPHGIFEFSSGIPVTHWNEPRFAPIEKTGTAHESLYALQDRKPVGCRRK